jgi:uncharacterized membrane protein YjjB (DUF3815 family)
MNFPLLLHPAAWGALGAAGFGVLFNAAFRSLPWCACSGTLMLALRTLVLQRG